MTTYLTQYLDKHRQLSVQATASLHAEGTQCVRNEKHLEQHQLCYHN